MDSDSTRNRVCGKCADETEADPDATDSDNLVETLVIPFYYKALVHSLSLSLPPLLFFLLVTLDMGYEQLLQESTRVLLTGLLPVFFWTVLLYTIAGGFDWQPGELGSDRFLLLFILGLGLFGIACKLLWLLIRAICAVAFRLPVKAACGKV